MFTDTSPGCFPRGDARGVPAARSTLTSRYVERCGLALSSQAPGATLGGSPTRSLTRSPQ